MSIQDHCDAFMRYLDDIGTPTGFRSSIVEAVAEKMALSYPDIYDVRACVNGTTRARELARR